jgi:hypothetical protein
MKKSVNNRGQVTIFIIVAIIIVVFAILVYLFYPKISSTLGYSAKSPSQEIQDCIAPSIAEAVNQLSLRGGSLEPELYYEYNYEKIGYLCYTNENYKNCVMQKPMLLESIQKEIKESIINSSNTCFENLEKTYTRQGYEVNLKKGLTEVEIVPNKIVVTYNHTLTLTKTDTQSYKEFKVTQDNNLYELLNIAISILGFETRYGDAETTNYMNYYHNLKVEKKKQSEGTKIYILTDRDSEEKFQFATRSVVWPPGYH